MEETIQKRRRGEGEKSIALNNTNQESAENILGMFFKVANKLWKTITNDARTTKPIKISMTYDIDKMLLFTTKLKNALIN